MKRFLKRLVVLALALLIAGFASVWLGLVPIAASDGHWAVTRWFLHFAMRQSVQTRSLGIEAPALADPALVLRGAGHYETGCAPCHGAPGAPRSPITRAMTPEPPFLPPRIGEWTPEQLFWIVKHGVKYTGMPAWPAQERDDEVWAVTAFLLRLPELDEDGYRELALGERAGTGVGRGEGHSRLRGLDDALEDALESCVRCHGRDGQGRGEGAFPKLANQRPRYLYESLRAFAEGKRHSGFMQPIAAGLSDANMRGLAEHYAEQGDAARVTAPGADTELLALGERIATEGVPKLGVPACTECHGPGDAPRNPLYPRLAGQYADYLYLQLQLFKQEQRGGTPYAHIMRTVTERMTPEQMRAVALYLASLAPE